LIFEFLDDCLFYILWQYILDVAVNIT